MKTAEERLHQTIAATDQKVENLRREIDMVKVNESVQRAQAAVALRGRRAARALGSAADSLKRIKERQAIQERSSAPPANWRTGAPAPTWTPSCGGRHPAGPLVGRRRAGAAEAPPDEPMAQLEAAASATQRAQPKPVGREGLTHR